MVHQKTLLSLFFVFSLLPGITIAKTDLIAYACSYHMNYTRNSTFQSNLQTALSISTTNINHGFYNVSDDWNADRLDVIGLCQGYLKPSSCRSCLDDSSKNLQQLCPNQKEAIGWANDCMIRYANRSILQKNETSPDFSMYNINNATDPTRFNKVVSGLLDNLRAKAAAGGPMLKYATGKTNSTTPSNKIYGLVQCTPDLSSEQCSNCLNRMFTTLPKCCNGKIGGRVFGPSCNFRYELYRFYDQTPMANAPEPAPEPEPAPVPAPAPAPIPQVIAPPPQAIASPPSLKPVTTTPTSSPTNSGLPPPPPPQGGGNRNLAYISLATLLVAISEIFIL